MPQLDPVTFLSQFFWLCVVFSALYLILVKFCLPSIARILKVREFIFSNSPTSFDQAKAPEIDSKNFSLAKKCFGSYPDLQFETKFLSDYNQKFLNEFSTSYQDTIIGNIVLSKYGRAKNTFFAQNSPMTKHTSKGSQVFYLKVFNSIKNSNRFVRTPK